MSLQLRTPVHQCDLCIGIAGHLECRRQSVLAAVASGVEDSREKSIARLVNVQNIAVGRIFLDSQLERALRVGENFSLIHAVHDTYPGAMDWLARNFVDN